MNEIILKKAVIPTILSCDYLVSSTPFKHVERTVPFNVLIFVTEGELYVTENGIDYEVGPGELLFLKSNVHCYGKKNMKPGLSWYYVHFSLPQNMENELRTRKTSSQIIIPKKISNLLHSEIEEEIKELNEQYQRRDEHSRFNCDAQLYLLLSDIAFYSKRVSSSSAQLAEKIENYLRENSHAKFNAHELESQFNLTEKYLEYVFKKEKKISLQKFHTKIRITESCILLRTTLFSIKEISRDMGYQDMLYFSRTFHSVCGISPTEYRKQIHTKY
jgi:AraC-like DNA-binding protein